MRKNCVLSVYTKRNSAGEREHRVRSCLTRGGGILTLAMILKSRYWIWSIKISRHVYNSALSKLCWYQQFCILKVQYLVPKLCLFVNKLKYITTIHIEQFVWEVSVFTPFWAIEKHEYFTHFRFYIFKQTFIQLFGSFKTSETSVQPESTQCTLKKIFAIILSKWFIHIL